MAFSELLRLVVDVNARGAVQGIEQVGRAADRQLPRSQQRLDQWANRLTGLGAGLIGVGAAAATGLAIAAQSAAQLEQAVGGTEAVFKDASGVIDRYAANAAEKVGLSERAFRDLSTVVGAQLKNLGFSVDEAADKSIELVEIGADLAATFGGTTQEAVEALGAAFRGEADPAERFGLRLNQAAVNAKAVELGLAESTSAVDANAKAQATLALIMEQSADAQGQWNRESDTAAHQQQVLAAQFEDLKAEIGQGAIPVLQALTTVTGSAIDAFSAMNDATGGVLGQFATWATVGAISVGALALIVGQAIKARDVIAALAARFDLAALSAARFRLALTTIGTVGAVVGGLLALREVLGTINDEIDRTNVSELENELLDLAETGEFAGETLKRIADLGDLRDMGKGGVAMRQFTTDVNQLDEALASLAGRDPGAAAESFERISEALQGQGFSASDVRDRFDNYAAAVANADTTNRTTQSAIEEATGAIDTQTGATEEATSALQEYAETLQAQFDPLFGMISAQQGLRDAQVGVTEAQAALNEALAGGDATAIAEAQRAYDDALFGSTQALVEAQSAQATLNDAVARGDVSLTDAQDALYRWAINAGYTGEQALTMAGQLGTATSAAQTLDAQNPTVDLRANDQATGPISLVKDRLTDLDGRYATVTVNQVWRSIGQAFGFGGTRAHGGPVSAGRLYEVAEQGRAELLEMGGRTYLIPGSDGTVVPAGGTAGGGGGGGSYVDNRTINIQTGSDPQAVVEAIKRYERGNGPGWRN